ncbi:uncharacterized protein YALI1_F24649g [Yarrowia lipolytica]|uniref:Secreted protein n=1 Tax=Yarrowia lipolytica TaxID=4952 RepID=A0A1D8NP14_YARLL|nr:hypothetical protein YALI1_F24649g [Yarrowia lipolytica]
MAFFWRACSPFGFLVRFLSSRKLNACPTKANKTQHYLRVMYITHCTSAEKTAHLSHYTHRSQLKKTHSTPTVSYTLYIHDRSRWYSAVLQCTSVSMAEPRLRD